MSTIINSKENIAHYLHICPIEMIKISKNIEFKSLKKKKYC